MSLPSPFGLGGEALCLLALVGTQARGFSHALIVKRRDALCLVNAL